MSNPLVRERVHRKVKATLAYEAQLINSGTIPARIYELIAKDSEAFRLKYQLPSWRGQRRKLMPITGWRARTRNCWNSRAWKKRPSSSGTS